MKKSRKSDISRSVSAKICIIGIDEVGRGPIAGPITVGAVLLNPSLRMRDFAGLRDSKKLSESKREVWYEHVCKEGIPWAVSSVSAREIDRVGINAAARRAAARSIESLIKKTKISRSSVFVKADYGLYAPDAFPQEQIVKGDEKEPAIALASIMAKVTRDRYMVSLSQKYPLYEFDRHKGYGTKVHIQALLQEGVVDSVHRISFLESIMTQ